MKKNVGTTDRIIRLLLAGILALLWFQNVVTGTWGLVLLGIAAIFVISSLFSLCPLYSLFGINTCQVKKSGQH